MNTATLCEGARRREREAENWLLPRPLMLSLCLALVSGSCKSPSAPEASVLVAIAGDGQTASVGLQTPIAPTVEVRDGSGAPVSRAVVHFQVLEGGGKVDPPVDTTTFDGRSTTRWTLGTKAGEPQRLRASVSQLSVDFTAAATAGSPATVEIVSGEGQSAPAGLLLSGELVVLVKDAFANPVPATAVSWVVQFGGGEAEPTQSNTDALGMARSRWVLGPAPGEQELRVRGVSSGGSVLFRATAQLVMDTIAAGGLHTCGISTAGHMYCWGINQYGELGHQPGGPQSQPVLVGGGFRWQQVTVGNQHTCGIDRDGNARCWGRNTFAQVGDGTTRDRAVPVKVQLDGPLRSISAGQLHTCAVSQGGVAFCWGDPSSGKLGTGSFDQLVPRQVTGGITFASVVAGRDHTCGLDPGGRAYCWGNNQYGQLGIGSTSQGEQTPRLVISEARFASISPQGDDHTCAVSTASGLLCWGRNRYGALGDGTLTDRHVPVAVIGGPWRQVVTGHWHTCGLASDWTSWCWGDNYYGQLGDGSSTNRLTPTRVSTAVSFVELASQGYHVCGRVGNGAVYCWGWNQQGQVGDGTTSDRKTPTLVRYSISGLPG